MVVSLWSNSRNNGEPMNKATIDRQLEAVCNNASVALLIADERGCCTYMNPAAAQLIGFALDEIRGKPLHDMIHHTRPDGSPYPAEECPLHLAYSRKAKNRGQEVLVRRDGSFYEVAFTVSPLNEEGEVVGTVLEMRNISEELRVQKALQQEADADAFLVTLADQLGALTDQAEIQRTAVVALGKHLKVARVHYAEIVERSNQVTEEYACGVPGLLGRLKAGGYRRVFGNEFRAGRILVVADLSADERLTPDEKAEYLSMGIAALVTVPLIRSARVVAIMRVCTNEPRQWNEPELNLIRETAERAWLAVERARAEQAVRDSERRFRQLADSMPQLVWFANPEGIVEYYNARVSEYGGIQAQPDGTWCWQPVLHPEDAAATEAAWQRAVRTGENYECEHRIRMRDGELRWHLSRAFPVLRNGEVRRWFGTATDIHDVKMAEQALQQANVQLAENSRLKDEFMAVVSHELRTPLTSILLHADLLAKRPEAAERIAPIITRNAQAQMRIVDDLLDSARIARGSLSVDLESLEFRSLIEEVVQQYLPRARACGIALNTELEPVAIEGDPIRLRQVLWNLLENSLRHTSEGGRITLALSRGKSVVELSVSDDGAGVDPQFIPIIFDRFRQEQASASREHGGLGLGLYLVKAIVEAHGGKAKASSSGRQRGLRITVELPLHRSGDSRRASD